MPQGGGKESGNRRTSFSPGTVLVALVFWLLAATGCRIDSINLVPPSEIHNLQGEGSFYLSGPDGAFRFRIGFYGRLPDEARLELFDPLGRLRTLVWLEGDRATLYLPSEKIYWQGEGRVLTSEIFGRELKVAELCRILTGLWAWLADEAGWQLKLDSQGRVLGGERDGLLFALKESFAPGLIPRTILFSSGDYKVRMKVMRIHFNRHQDDWLFNPAMPTGVRKLEWEEVSGLWKK